MQGLLATACSFISANYILCLLWGGRNSQFPKQKAGLTGCRTSGHWDPISIRSGPGAPQPSQKLNRKKNPARSFFLLAAQWQRLHTARAQPCLLLAEERFALEQPQKPCRAQCSPWVPPATPGNSSILSAVGNSTVSQCPPATPCPGAQHLCVLYMPSWGLPR